MKKLILMFLILLTNCSQKQEVNKPQIIDLAWKEFNSKDSIPKQIKDVLQALNNDTKIADKNEDYEATDNIQDTTLPSRQLKLLAKKNNDWRLVYKQGGIGTYYVYIQCKIDNDSLYDLKVGNTLLHIENNDSLSKIIENKMIPLRSIKTRNQ